MAVDYHVFGAAQIQVGTGSANALETLGFTEDGGDIAITHHERPIMTDVGGTELPAEMQMMGEDAVITLRMPLVDNAILNKLLQRNDATTPSPGVQGTAGKLMGTGGYSFRLALVPPSGSAEDPWLFLHAKIRSHQRKEGTPHTLANLTFFAWTYLAGTDITRKDKVLYQRTLS